MSLSVIGLVVCAAIWLVGWRLGAPLIIGLMASLAFGTTSAMTLGAIGGSSPLIYFVFAAALVLVFGVSPGLPGSLTAAFHEDWVPWAVCGLAAYSAAGAVVLPRLFAGQTSAFVTGRDTGVVEVSLVPSAGNVTQTGYFILGALTFIALYATLLRGAPLATLKRGIWAWAGVNLAGGLIDLIGKSVGAGDVMMPIRTATFAYLTDVEQAGFARINGTYSEASSFGAASLASMAFAYAYWKHGGSRLALLVAGTLLVLLVLSTSSTAYVGLAALILPVVLSLIRAIIRGELKRDGIVVMIGALVVGGIVVFVVLYNSSALEPFQKLFQTTLIDKSQSESGRERSYWNERSLVTVADTFGLGIGFGSSRASNWFVAVLSQLGLIGALLQGAIIIPFFRRVRRPARSSAGHDAFVLHEALRSCALTTLVAGALGGGSPDPGMLFFAALAGVLACQAALRRTAQVDAPSRSPSSITIRPALPRGVA